MIHRFLFNHYQTFEGAMGQAKNFKERFEAEVVELWSDDDHIPLMEEVAQAMVHKFGYEMGERVSLYTITMTMKRYKANIHLDGFNGEMARRNVLNYGIYVLLVEFNGEVSIYHAKGRSFVKAAMAGPGPTRVKSLDEAIATVKERSRYVWDHNDREYLIREYGLSREFVREFLGSSYWPGE